MLHRITIRDVAAVSHAVSCMGTADLRDAALAAAPHAAEQGATREHVAAIAASLIVRATNGNPEAHGLPDLSREQLERASAAVPRPALPSDRAADALEDELRAARGRLSLVLDALDAASRGAPVDVDRVAEALGDDVALSLESLVGAVRDLPAAERARDGFRRELDEAAARAVSLEEQLTTERADHASTKRAFAANEVGRSDLASKLTACEALVAQLNEQLAAAQAAPADPASTSKAKK